MKYYELLKYELLMPMDGPFIRHESAPKIFNWLYDNIGKRHWLWEWHWNSNGPCKFLFKHEEDKVKFILKWL